MPRKKRRAKKVSNKAFGNKFHRKLEHFLRDVGFVIERSAYSGEGPDIVAKDDETKTKLVIQCKATRTRKTFGSIDALIKEYAEWRRDYKATLAVIALKGYRLKKTLELKKIYEKRKVRIITDEVIREYFDLYKKIGRYAKYQILADLGISKRVDGKTLRVPALQVKQPAFTFFVSTIPANWLLKAASVYRRVGPQNHVKGYQRILNKKRVKVDIPKYLSEKDWALPNTIICATEIGSRRRIRFNRGSISMVARTGSLWVIDGQHRLYSFANVSDEIKSERLLTVVIDSARLREKAESIHADMFFNLNSHAQRVKQSLVLDLLKDLLQTDDIRLLVAFDLCKSKLLAPVIKTYSKDDGFIDIVTISSTQPMVQLTSKKGPILRGRKYDPDKAVKAVSSYIQDYFKIVKSVFRKEWEDPKYIICDNRGFRVLTRILYQIIVKNRRASKREVLRLAKKSLLKLKSNTTFEVAGYKGEGLGEAGASKLAEKWIGIFSGISLTDAIPKRESENTEFKSSFKWDMNTDTRNDSLAGEVTKAVCAFQNTFGGTLFVGVDDNANLIGIEKDLSIFSSKRNPEDTFLRSIQDILKKDLGAAAAAAAQTTIHERNGKQFVTITVDQSSKPVFVRRTKFYYRSGASCQAPEGEDQHEYIKDHFSP